jgi:hypothetical protein
MENKDVFSTLNAINVNEHVEKKNTGKASLSYLSWSWAWAEVKKKYPNASYEIVKFENGLPYSYDPKTGYMCYTRVTIDDITHEMWLPVMDSHNEAMLDHERTVKTKNFEYKVPACTMFDVNKTVMRCLTKNLAMFGLGLYIYAGEDLPEEEVDGKIMNTVLEIETYGDLLTEDQKQKISKAKDEKNIQYLETILNWCKNKRTGNQEKKGA